MARIKSVLIPITDDGEFRWVQVGLLYLLSHGFMLLCWNALYWDDWITYAGGGAETRSVFDECIRCIVPFRGQVEGLLVAPGPWLMRALTFLYFPLIASLTRQFLLRTEWLRRDESSVIALLVLFLPMFGARIALIDYHYSFSLLLFAVGAWMTLSQRRGTRLASLLPLFWSMFTQSFQVFVVVIVVIILAKLVTQKTVVTVDRVVVLTGLLAFPLLHRYGIPAIFPDLKVVDEYNTIRVAFLVRAVLVAGALTAPLVAVAVRNRYSQRAQRSAILLAVGLTVLAAGTFPYLVVGHFPNISDWILPLLPDQSDWNSRHQLLQPFGVAFIILGVSEMMFHYRRAFILFVIGVSICLNAATYSGYFLDSLKQEEVINFMSENGAAIGTSTALVIEDLAHDYNARGRGVRPYEWQAMAQRALGKKILVDSFSPTYCQIQKPEYILRVTTTGGRLKGLMTLRAAVAVTLEPLLVCN